MSSLVGKTLAHYEVREELGRGGMGVVYRGWDPRLARDVALKVLPPELVSDPERRRRFTIEARAAAQLEHPHIGVVHEIDEAEGTIFIAMEMIRGRRLSEEIDSGRLSLPRSLDLATEIAEGLARAHDAGVLHRDLKPANVMVTEDGHAKIIDFGLAKLRERTDPADDSETISEGDTDTGVVVGTRAYMSPEQARGLIVDHRSDIFSFGVTLYEMLMRKRPFGGPTPADALQALLAAPPPPVRLPDGLDSSDAQRIVEKCLAKDPADRYQGSRDVIVDLRAARRRIESGPLSGPSAGRGRFPSSRGALLAGSLVLALVVAVGVRHRLQSSRVRWARDVAVPEITRLAKEERLQAALRLARQAAPLLPDDRRLQEQIEEMTHVTKIESEPAGAQAFFADYMDPAAEWELAGTTPVAPMRVPYGLLRWKLTKEGFEETLTTAWAGGGSLQFVLRAKGTVPPGMVGVPGGDMPWGEGKTFSLDDYWLDRYEVTNAEYKRFVDAGGYKNQEYWKEPFVGDGRTLSWAEAMARFRDRTGRPGPATWSGGAYPEEEGDRPVGGVSWYEAWAFAQFAGKSLPTIYHWMHAAQTGETTSFSDTFRLSNFGDNGPLPVGKSRALGTYGTYDLAGNVREWGSNAVGDGSRRPLLGGAWSDPVVMSLMGIPTLPMDRPPANGFRCARYTRPPSAEVLRPYLWPEPSWHPPVGDAAFNLYRGLYSYSRRDLQAKAESAEDSVYWRHETVSYDAGYEDERVLAHLFLPKNAKPPYQVVIHFPYGWATAIKSSRALEMRWVAFIVRSGRALLWPVFKGTYERTPKRDPENVYAEWTVDWAKELGRSIDYLETRREIDSKGIGYYGFSLGAVQGPVFAAVEPRLKTMILLSGGVPPGTLPPHVDSLNFAPRATIPTLMVNGKGDFQLTKASRHLFDLLGTPPDKKRQALLEGGHALGRLDDLIREVLDWLDRTLGPVA